MKLIHLSDLHLGIRFNEFPLAEDQRHILNEILRIIDDEKPQAVVIAGDIYDKPVPPAEAVAMFDDFLYELAQREQQVFVISGNHDSAERIAFGSRLMGASGVHLSPVYGGRAEPVVLNDEHGEVGFYMLPFVKPIHVRSVFPDEQIDSYTDALRCAVEHMEIDESRRNVLITHQFVTGAQRCDSEMISVGGTDNVDAAVFSAFDYTALGHIHGPQNVAPNVRYCGTPLKYSFSEKDHQKSVTVVELGTKGDTAVRTVPLKPLRDVREIRGTYAELTYLPNYENTAREDFLRAVLTDETPVPNAMPRLREIYPNICELRYDNAASRAVSAGAAAADVENKTELELLEEFFEIQNGKKMTDEQRAFCTELFDKIKEGE